MRPLPVPLLAAVLVAATGFGLTLAQFVASRGATIPISGWLTGILLLAVGGVLLAVGLPLRRYMIESEERSDPARSSSHAPRRHQVDMITAYRTVLFARTCAYTGSVLGGIHLGLALQLEVSGTGTFLGATLPTLFAGIAGIALMVLGVIVERWGQLPPEDGEMDGESSPA